MTSDLTITTIQQPSVPSVEKVESIKEICRIAATSGLLQSNSKDMGQRMADSFFVAMYGYELGIAPITALQQIFVINGKPSCSGQLMLSLVRRAGFTVDMPDPSTITDRATVGIQRPGGTMKRYTYTVEMAKQAGLYGKGMWTKYPREMLMWRAVSTACRMEAGDVIGGLYTVEEISPEAPVDADGALVTVTPTKAPRVEPETAEPPQPQRSPLPRARKRDDSPLGENAPAPEPPKKNPYTAANEAAAAAKAAQNSPQGENPGPQPTLEPPPYFLATQAGKDRLKALLGELSVKTGRPGAEIIVQCTKALGVAAFSDAVDADGQPLTEAALFAKIRGIVTPPPAVSLENPALVAHVRYITRNKQSYLAFLPQPWHPELEIRQYGRSTAFKKMVGDTYYGANAFDAMEQNTEQPYEIAPILIEWEMKGDGEHAYMVAKTIQIVTDDASAGVLVITGEIETNPPSELDQWFASDGTQTPF